MPFAEALEDPKIATRSANQTLACRLGKNTIGFDGISQFSDFVRVAATTQQVADNRDIMAFFDLQTFDYTTTPVSHGSSEGSTLGEKLSNRRFRGKRI